MPHFQAPISKISEADISAFRARQSPYKQTYTVLGDVPSDFKYSEGRREQALSGSIRAPEQPFSINLVEEIIKKSQQTLEKAKNHTLNSPPRPEPSSSLSKSRTDFSRESFRKLDELFKKKELSDHKKSSFVSFQNSNAPTASRPSETLPLRLSSAEPRADLYRTASQLGYLDGESPLLTQQKLADIAVQKAHDSIRSRRNELGVQLNFDYQQPVALAASSHQHRNIPSDIEKIVQKYNLKDQPEPDENARALSR